MWRKRFEFVKSPEVTLCHWWGCKHWINKQTKSIISFCHSTSENEPVVYIICLQPGQTFVKFLAICLQFWVRSHRYCDKKFIQEASLCSVYCPVHFCTADCYCYFYTRIRDSALLGKVTRYRRASDVVFLEDQTCVLLWGWLCIWPVLSKQGFTLPFTNHHPIFQCVLLYSITYQTHWPWEYLYCLMERMPSVLLVINQTVVKRVPTDL